MKGKIIRFACVLLLIIFVLFPINRTCGKKGAVCAYPPKNTQQTACYSVARKPLIADILNVDLSYSVHELCH